MAYPTSVNYPACRLKLPFNRAHQQQGLAGGDGRIGRGIGGIVVDVSQQIFAIQLGGERGFAELRALADKGVQAHKARQCPALSRDYAGRRSSGTLAIGKMGIDRLA